jgi:hypothetical protein
MKPDLGIYYDMLDSIAAVQSSLSFLADSWLNVEDWRKKALAKTHELLAFNPPLCPLNPKVDSRLEEEDLVVEKISYDMPYGPRTEGFFTYPNRRTEKCPAIVALHDHGGFFYYGKEKITTIPNEPRILTEFKRKYYGGRSWATELARRGFAVLSADVFLWGSRRIPFTTVNETFQKSFQGIAPDSEEYIRKYNEFWENNECPLDR